MSAIPTRLVPILFLLASNVFMTFAWYGHLKFRDRPLWLVIPVSWGIAFFEYCLAVPANRIGSRVYSAAELKAIQEVITLTVFAAFSFLYLGQKLSPGRDWGLHSSPQAPISCSRAKSPEPPARAAPLDLQGGLWFRWAWRGSRAPAF
jgi:uncharacterized protein (DUF486 family)